jgi:hypothetical protein
MNLVIPRQRMHDNHIRLSALEHLIINHKRVLHLLEARRVREPLLLHARAIQDIRRRDNLGCEFVRDGIQLATGLEAVAHALGHTEGLGRHEVDVHVVVREELAQRVHGAAVLEVADEGNVEPVDGAKFFTDREDVEDGLRRVLAATVASVDDGDAGEFGCDVDGFFGGVTQDDGVGVAA